MNRPPFDLVEARRSSSAGSTPSTPSHPLRAVLPGRVHGHDHMSAIVVTLFFGGPDGPGFARSLRWLWPILWFARQDRHLPLHLRLDPRRAAPASLRPAHGPGLEAPDPVLARLAPRRRRASGSAPAGVSASSSAALWPAEASSGRSRSPGAREAAEDAVAADGARGRAGEPTCVCPGAGRGESRWPTNRRRWRRRRVRSGSSAASRSP